MKDRVSAAVISCLIIFCLVFLGACNGSSDNKVTSAPAASSASQPVADTTATAATATKASEAATAETDPQTTFNTPQKNPYTGNPSSNTSSNGQGIIDDPKRTTITVGNNGYVTSVGDTVTYTCRLKTPGAIEDVQASTNYDGSMLKLISADVKAMFPVLGDSTVVNTNVPGTVIFNASNIRGYDFTKKGTLIELKFKVTGKGGTSITTAIEFMDEKGGKPYVDSYTIMGNISLEESLAV